MFKSVEDRYLLHRLHSLIAVGLTARLAFCDRMGPTSRRTASPYGFSTYTVAPAEMFSASSRTPPPSLMALRTSPRISVRNADTSRLIASLGTGAAASTISLMVSDRRKVINPTPDRPITINVYGAPDGVITPASATITKGRFVTFSYNGQFFPNPITIEAYVSNGTGGQAIGVTQILPKNRLDCV
jgi:hypothetical protein